ncbi:uncharacterized protein EI97DRAFT_430860 [Westerdykella ornata]|uniref:Uncharacterized protein n=1 Tax=Westerdykella ornata TaxID=318751 RepID=A0A6A6JQP5_WESOR|nr:uncharacterized protein EI97DRAFT_430860 [Westerdykella ornata]KAF2278585.1 hypothetical protein EI97DRAFT_430860 [Westerdykella ornata]
MLLKSSLVLALLPSLITAWSVRNVIAEGGEPVLDKRNSTSATSGCDEGLCPDNSAAVDFLAGLGGWRLRVNDCGECLSFPTEDANGACVDFASCGGRPQTVCVDRGDGIHGRMHRIWKDANVKKCYRVEKRSKELTCGTGVDGFWTDVFFYSQMEETGCNW